MIKSIAFLFLVAVLAAFDLASAHAQALRPRALIEGELIRLGDLFSTLPDETAQRAVAPAPAPGRTTLFDAAALTRIAREMGLAWIPQTRFDRALVQRASRSIAVDDIEARIFAELKAEGLPEGFQIELANRRIALDAAIGRGPAFEIQSLNYDKRDGIFTATLAVATGEDSSAPVEVRGVAFRTARVPVLSRPFRHGQVISSDDITFKEQRAGSLDPNLVLDVDAIAGKTPRTSVRAGEPLRRTDLMAPVVVAKGELVTMVLHTPQMTLTAQGRATENGADGQTIRVENTRSKTAIEATVIGPNRVSVHVPSLAALAK